MKRLFALTFVILLTATFSPRLAFSQTSPVLQADIPFEFVVRDMKLEPGQYTLTRFTPKIWMLEGPNKTTTFVLTRQQLNGEMPDSPKLLFNRYGEDRYFLNEIVSSGPRSAEVVMCSQEKAFVETSWTAKPVALNLRVAGTGTQHGGD